MSGYIGTTPVPQATQHREAFTANANQTTFATAGYTVGFIDVWLNGVKLAAADITVTNGSDIVLASAAAANDIIEYVAFVPFNAANQTFTGATVINSLNVNGDGATVTGIKDEDNMASNDANKLATQQSIKAYVDSTVAATNEVVEDTTPQLGGNLASNGNDILMADNDKVIFGGELEIYSDATHARIREYGSGQMKIQGDNMQLLTSNGASTYLEGNASSGAVTLYHASNAPRIATTSAGISVTGAVAVTGTVDGIDIAARDSVLTSTTTTAGAALPKAGGAMTGDLILGDNVKLEVGSASGGDLQIYHDGTNSYIKHVLTSGWLNIPVAGNGVSIANADFSEIIASFKRDAEVALYHNGSKKFETTSAGISVTGEISLSDDINILDGKAARFGTGEDLSIYNDGSHTYLRNSTSNQDIIFLGNDDGSANTQMLKLDASAAGAATFGGTVTTTGLTVGNSNVGSNTSHLANLTINNNSYIGSANATNAIKIGTSGAVTFGGTVLIDGLSNYTGLEVKGVGAARPQVKFTNVNQGVLGAIYGTEGNALVISTGTGGATAMTIDSSQRVGIGVVPESAWGSNYTALDIGTAMSLWGSKAGASFAAMSDNLYFNNSAYKARNTGTSAMYYQNAGAHYFQTGASASADATVTLSTKMIINSSGNLLVNGATSNAKISSKGSSSLRAMNVQVAVDGHIGIGFFNTAGTDVGGIGIRSGGASISLGGNATANTLDDYEEGTCTMTIGASTTNPTIGQGNTFTAYYTKVGNKVTVTGYSGTRTITNAGSGIAKISGLPFTCKANAYAVVTMGHNTMFTSTNEGYIEPNSGDWYPIGSHTTSGVTYPTGAKVFMFTAVYLAN